MIPLVQSRNNKNFETALRGLFFMARKLKKYSAGSKQQAEQDHLPGNTGRSQKRLRCMTQMEFPYTYAA